LIEVGAVRRDGTRYRLGASLLGLGALVSPERRLRVAARRPMAELAAATGAAVSLSGTIGGEVVFLDTVDARVPLRFLAEPGARVPAGTAQARAHAEIGRLAPVVDAAGVLPDVSCVRSGSPRRHRLSGVALVAGMPPLALLAATERGARISGPGALHKPVGPVLGKVPQWSSVPATTLHLTSRPNAALRTPRNGFSFMGAGKRPIDQIGAISCRTQIRPRRARKCFWSSWNVKGWSAFSLLRSP
jgi:hypothetical protein